MAQRTSTTSADPWRYATTPGPSRGLPSVPVGTVTCSEGLRGLPRSDAEPSVGQDGSLGPYSWAHRLRSRCAKLGASEERCTRPIGLADSGRWPSRSPSVDRQLRRRWFRSGPECHPPPRSSRAPCALAGGEPASGRSPAHCQQARASRRTLQLQRDVSQPLPPLEPPAPRQLTDDETVATQCGALQGVVLSESRIGRWMYSTGRPDLQSPSPTDPGVPWRIRRPAAAARRRSRRWACETGLIAGPTASARARERPVGDPLSRRGASGRCRAPRKSLGRELGHERLSYFVKQTEPL